MTALAIADWILISEPPMADRRDRCTLSRAAELLRCAMRCRAPLFASQAHARINET